MHGTPEFPCAAYTLNLAQDTLDEVPVHWHEELEIQYVAAGEVEQRVPEMKSYAELKDDPAFQAWCEDAEHNACPNGESAPQVLARNLAAIQPVLDAGEDAVCVIHGGVTAGLLMHWFGGIRYDYPVAPGTGYQVTFEGGKPVSYRPVP